MILPQRLRDRTVGRPGGGATARRYNRRATAAPTRSYFAVTQVFLDSHAYPIIEGVGHGGYVVHGLIQRNALDPPHRDEHRGQPDIALAANNHPDPVVKCVDIDTHQKYARA